MWGALGCRNVELAGILEGDIIDPATHRLLEGSVEIDGLERAYELRDHLRHLLHLTDITPSPTQLPIRCALVQHVAHQSELGLVF